MRQHLAWRPGRHLGNAKSCIVKAASALQPSSISLKNLIPGGKTLSPKIAVSEPVAGKGRSLVAVEDIPADEILISIPLEDVFTTHELAGEEEALPWSVTLALKILKAKCSSEEHSVWLSALPRQIQLPVTTFSEEDLQACGDKDVIEDALSVRAMFENAYEVLEEELNDLEASKGDFMQALSVVHSRVFIRASETMLGLKLDYVVAPGIDMANHSFWPNSTVQIVSSPEAVQGMDASSEICDMTNVKPTVSVLLMAKGELIRQGEEVTVSYGDHTDEAFFMYFGFLPAEEDFNFVSLFNNHTELIKFLEKDLARSEGRSIAVPKDFPALGDVIDQNRKYCGRQGGAFDAELCNEILKWLQAAEAHPGESQRAAPKGFEEGSNSQLPRPGSDPHILARTSDDPEFYSEALPLSAGQPDGPEGQVIDKPTMERIQQEEFALETPSEKHLFQLKRILNSRCRQLQGAFLECGEKQERMPSNELLDTCNSFNKALSLKYRQRKLDILESLICATA